jgi:hypothetical protein
VRLKPGKTDRSLGALTRQVVGNGIPVCIQGWRSSSRSGFLCRALALLTFCSATSRLHLSLPTTGGSLLLGRAHEVPSQDNVLCPRKPRQPTGLLGWRLACEALMCVGFACLKKEKGEH